MIEIPDSAREFILRPKVLIGGSVGLILVISLAVVLSLPTPKPDVWDDGLDDVAGFFFDEDFNRLPAEERLEMLTEFVARFRDGGQEESAMLAMFVADVTHDMRKQVEENMMKLGVELWSGWGEEYGKLPADEREDYISELLVKLEKMGEEMVGQESEKTDSERLAGMEQQAGRDRDRMREGAGNKPADSGQVAGFMGLYSGQVASRASARDRAVIITLTRDISRHLRGESIDDGGGG